MLVGEAPANLAFAPLLSKPVTVRSTYRDGLPQTVHYQPGQDYLLDASGQIRRTPGSRIPDFGTNMLYGKEDRSYGALRTDYVFETKDVTTVNAPGEPAETKTTQRYRVSFQQRLFLTDDIYATADINLLSDVDFLQDFYPNEYRINPQPDNVLSLRSIPVTLTSVNG